ncbi:hypothetical protein [Moraxella cuniculi]|uniref:Uncharacterized protein n=1 Tax=Moraxella cuniculi TaxID=34061 RepID=A0A3S5EFY3_9GAMM|nr:hypothetical protein [Moraxella cuniculi]VEG13308.1 Uncharacterised protein [Moraxella cuniculi]
MNKFNKLLSAVILAVVSNVAQAADWTPVFSQWNSGCPAPWSEDFKWREKVLYNIQSVAQIGNYQGVPQPYRDDLLPAYIASTHEEVLDYFIIPMRNATFVGLPIKSYTFLADASVGFFYRGLNFGRIDRLNVVKILRAFGGTVAWEGLLADFYTGTGGLSQDFGDDVGKLYLYTNDKDETILQCWRWSTD